VEKMKNFKSILTIIIALLVLSLAACGGQPSGNEESQSSGGGEEEANENKSSDVEAQNFNFGAATQGGFWYALGGAYAMEIEEAIPGSSVTVIEGGSVSNLLGLEQGKFQMGFSNGQTVPEALNGEGNFEKKAENVRWAATLYPNVMHIVVREDSDIHSIKDLKGKKVSPGIKGYSGELAFQNILDINGMSYDDLSKIEYVGTADGANLLRDGHIDAMVGMLAAPVSTFQELDTTLGIRIISLEDETISKMKEINNGFSKYVIGKDVYQNIDSDANTISAYTTFLVHKDLSEDTVYTLMKTLFDNKDTWSNLNTMMSSFNEEFSIENKIGPIHPGAEKFYKEAGVLK
jgi:TRAP transporter TAXI family solute receptor